MTAKGINGFLAMHAVVLASAIGGFSSAASACCPDDGQTAPKAMTGLGDSFPPSVNLAADPLWRVYEFERDGIRYVQINDAAGTVHAAAGQIAGTFWVMPIGSDADRVSLPEDALPAGRARVLYRGRDFEIILVEGEARPRWVVRAPASR
ncbi:hypothetical protein [Sphingomonas sp.]|uniref:hypothetical protein n=1 Tax=Sphingomonas sp. TaxID=28214 RepID=UPI0035B009FA